MHCHVSDKQIPKSKTHQQWKGYLFYMCVKLLMGYLDISYNFWMVVTKHPLYSGYMVILYGFYSMCIELNETFCWRSRWVLGGYRLLGTVVPVLEAKFQPSKSAMERFWMWFYSLMPRKRCTHYMHSLILTYQTYGFSINLYVINSVRHS